MVQKVSGKKCRSCRTPRSAATVLKRAQLWTQQSGWVPRFGQQSAESTQISTKARQSAQKHGAARRRPRDTALWRRRWSTRAIAENKFFVPSKRFGSGLAPQPPHGDRPHIETSGKLTMGSPPTEPLPTSSGHRGKLPWSSTMACEKVAFLACFRALMNASKPAYLRAT